MFLWLIIRIKPRQKVLTNPTDIQGRYLIFNVISLLTTRISRQVRSSHDSVPTESTEWPDQSSNKFG